MSKTIEAEHSRLPTREEAARAASLLLRCNGHDLDTWGAGGLVDDDAREALSNLAAGSLEDDLKAALSKAENAWPGCFWHLAKGRVRADEPMFGFQVLFGADEVLSEGEGDSAEQAISAALAKATPKTEDWP